MRVQTKEVLLAVLALFLLNLFFMRHSNRYRALLSVLSYQTLYQDSEFLYNNRNPRSSFRVEHSARLAGLQMYVEVRLEGLFLPSNNALRGNQLLQQSESEREESGRVISKIHESMFLFLHDYVGSPSLPYWFALPREAASRFTGSLASGSFMSYKVMTLNKPSSCGLRNGWESESIVVKVAPMPSSTTDSEVKPTRGILFEESLTISAPNPRACENKHSRTTVVFIPGPAGPGKLELWWTQLWKYLFQPFMVDLGDPKCFVTARAIKNFSYRYVPDTIVSILLCY